MKVLVVNNAAPFTRGGAEELADHLVRRLNGTKGVEAELLRIPFRWEPAERIVEEIVLNRNLRLYNVDRVIALKFPAYFIPHAEKTLWLLHQFRQAYDLYESGLSHLCTHARGAEIIRLVRTADQELFASCRRIFTNSPVTQSRLKTFNGFGADVLYPPLNDACRFKGGDYGNYIFAGGRVGAGKRQELLVEAMRHACSDIKLVIAGPPDDEANASRLEALVATYDLRSRVELRLGYRPREEIAALANGALACAYLPIDEDSLGYVTMEAFSASKAVITARDAGGLLEIVHDAETGIVVPPDPQAIAAAFDRLAGNRDRTIAMGRAAKNLLESKNLNWETTISRLLD
jgi:glycosyltransferase involved in cell wall biosynthesis